MSRWSVEKISRDLELSSSEEPLYMWVGSGESEPETFDIHTAASLGHLPLIRHYAEANPSGLDQRNRCGWTPLMYACYYGHDDIASLLVSLPVRLDLHDNQGYSALTLACFNRETACLSQLIKAGANVNLRDKHGLPPLFHATLRGHMDIVKILIVNGADENAVEPSQGLTPLMLAAMKGFEAIFEILLLNGADPRKRSFAGSTARCFASVNGYHNITNIIARNDKSADVVPEFKLWPTSRKQLQSCLSRPRHLSIFDDYITPRSKHSMESMILSLPLYGQTEGYRGTGRRRSLDFHSSSHFGITKGQLSNHPSQREPSVEIFKEFGVENVIPILKKEEIDTAVFLNMTDEDFRQIGIHEYREICSLLMIIERLKGAESLTKVQNF